MVNFNITYYIYQRITILLLLFLIFINGDEHYRCEINLEMVCNVLGFGKRID